MVPAIKTEKVSISFAPEPFLSSTDRGTSCNPTLRLNTMPSFSLNEDEVGMGSSTGNEG